MNSLLRIMCAVGVVLAVICLTGCRGEERSADAQQDAGPPPPLVAVRQLGPRDLSMTRTYVGHVQGRRFAEVRAQVGGILKKRLFREGQEVRAGETLYELEAASYQTVVDQAAGQVAGLRARLEKASRDLKRVTPLAARNSVSPRDRDAIQAEYDATRAELGAAEASLRAAKIDFGMTRVKAPISGFTTVSLRPEGSLVMPGSDAGLLTTLYDTSTVDVIFSVPDSELRRIQGYLASGRAVMGRKITARLFLGDEQPYPHAGAMVFGNPVVRPETGCMMAKAEFPNPEKLLLPGQVVRLQLDLLTFENAVAIPEQALIQGRDGAAVIVVADDDTVSFRPVQSVARIDHEVVIGEGLNGTERIVVEGTGKVGPGMKVAPRPAEGQNGASSSAERQKG